MKFAILELAYETKWWMLKNMLNNSWKGYHLPQVKVVLIVHVGIIVGMYALRLGQGKWTFRKMITSQIGTTVNMFPRNDFRHI